MKKISRAKNFALPCPVTVSVLYGCDVQSFYIPLIKDFNIIAVTPNS